MSLVPDTQCPTCLALQERYERALLAEMLLLYAHERGGVESAGAEQIENASRTRRQACAELRHHVLMNHPEIAGAKFVS